MSVFFILFMSDPEARARNEALAEAVDALDCASIHVDTGLLLYQQ